MFFTHHEKKAFTRRQAAATIQGSCLCLPPRKNLSCFHSGFRQASRFWKHFLAVTMCSLPVCHLARHETFWDFWACWCWPARWSMSVYVRVCEGSTAGKQGLAGLQFREPFLRQPEECTVVWRNILYKILLHVKWASMLSCKLHIRLLSEEISCVEMCNCGVVKKEKTWLGVCVQVFLCSSSLDKILLNFWAECILAYLSSLTQAWRHCVLVGYLMACWAYHIECWRILRLKW